MGIRRCRTAFKSKWFRSTDQASTFRVGGKVGRRAAAWLRPSRVILGPPGNCYARDHTVIITTERYAVCRSPGYRVHKKNQAVRHAASWMHSVEKAELVTHESGNMVG